MLICLLLAFKCEMISGIVWWGFFFVFFFCIFFFFFFFVYQVWIFSNPEHFVCNTADKETSEMRPRCNLEKQNRS